VVPKHYKICSTIKINQSNQKSAQLGTVIKKKQLFSLKKSQNLGNLRHFEKFPLKTDGISIWDSWKTFWRLTFEKILGISQIIGGFLKVDFFLTKIDLLRHLGFYFSNSTAI
jgi:hypothetical protein